MKVKIIRHPFRSDELISRLCCLNCDKTMVRIEKDIKIGKQFGEDGWYCMHCKLFFFERDGVMYYSRIRNKCPHDTFERCKKEHFAVFVKKKSSCPFRID